MNSGLPQKQVAYWDITAIDKCLPKETVYRDGRFWARMPNSCTGSYAGSTVEKANVRYLQEHFKTFKIWHCGHWHDGYVYSLDPTTRDYIIPKPLGGIPQDTQIVVVSYAYSTEECWYDLSSSELQEMADGLVDYPAIDDELVTEIEQELLSEFMKDFCKEFASKHLEKLLDVSFYSLHGNSEAQDRWLQQEENLADNVEPVILKVMEELNIYPYYETGCGVWIDPARVYPAVMEYLQDPENAEELKKLLETPTETE